LKLCFLQVGNLKFQTQRMSESLPLFWMRVDEAGNYGPTANGGKVPLCRLWHGARRTAGASPQSPMLNDAQMSAIVRESKIFNNSSDFERGYGSGN
jgi:hypothetical protein